MSELLNAFMIYELHVPVSIFNSKFVFFSKALFFFLTVFMNDGSNDVPVMSTPVRAGRPVPRFASPAQIVMSSADSDRYYFLMEKFSVSLLDAFLLSGRSV